MCINKEIRLKTALTICHMYKVINEHIEDLEKLRKAKAEKRGIFEKNFMLESSTHNMFQLIQQMPQSLVFSVSWSDS